MSKSYQLRVRLDGELYQQLTERVASGTGKFLLSDLVRSALVAYLKPMAAPNGETSISVSPQMREQLHQLSEQLERRENYVLEDCVQGIIDCFEEDKVPLIVQELRLRREFFFKMNS